MDIIGLEIRLRTILKNKNKMVNWKIIAIVFVCLFVAENFLLGVGIYLVAQEENMLKECYYKVCEGYPDADLIDNICTCYEYDLIDNLIPVKHKIMG